jgi:FAS-associated factor 2
MTHSETLERARATRAVHEAGRAIREQQNSAYELSLARDREIARARREEAERKAREEELARARADEKVLLAKNRTAWRQWRATTIPKVEPTGKDTARVSIRLRNGERVIRRFNGDANMEEVYAFVECLEYLNESATNEKTPEKPSGYTHEYGFKLVSPMPRQVYQLQSEKGGSESAVKDCLWPTASLVVEVDDDEDDEGGEDN